MSYSGKNRRQYQAYGLLDSKLEVDLGRDEIDIIVEALYRYGAEMRGLKARTSQDAMTLRKRLIVLEVAQLGERTWDVATPALPPEST